MKIRKLKLLLLLLISALCFMLSSGTCSAASYSITDQELTRLENNLTQLQQYNEKSLKELATLKTQLKTSQDELKAAKEQSNRLVLQLDTLKEKSSQAESLLKTANESLAVLEQEERRTRLRLKRQRNTKRGIRNRFKLGQPRYTKIMGYDNDWELNEDAEIVRAIFDLAFDGYSKREIETILNENNIKTPNNKEKWCCESVLGILRNEKYIGDVHMQKTYTGNFLIHDKVYNREATVDSYYREDHHEGIVDRELFDALAFETCLKRGHVGAEQTPYFGMLRCPTCGRAMVKIPGIYTEKRDIWICPGDGVEGRLLNRSCCEKVPVFSTELDKTITKAVLEMEPEPGFDEAIERLKDLVLRNGQPSYCRLVPLIEKMYMESADTLVVHWKMGWTGKYQIGEAVNLDKAWDGIAKAYVANEIVDGREAYRVLHPLRKKEIRDRVDGKAAG